MSQLARIVTGLLLLSFSLSSGNAYEIQKGQSPVILLNAENSSGLPFHFRTTNQLHLNQFPNTLPSTGLQDTRISGSAQYSKLQLVTMLSQLPSPVILVDLRQESHGFINDGMAISWYGYHNWANLHKSRSQVIKTEKKLLKNLLVQKTADIYQMSKAVTFNFHEPDKELLPWKTLEISAAFPESQLGNQVKVGYFRLPIPDHRKPSDKSVDTFLKFIKKVPPNTWLHFHCAARDGRTTTFMAMYDMIKNAKQVSWQDIVARQAVIGPLDLAKMPDPKHWRYKLTVDRLEFIKKFHQYIIEVGDSFDPLWSEWIKKNH